MFNKGYTLVELVTVMALIGVLSLLAAGPITTQFLDKSKLTSAVKTLQSQIETAQTMAMSQQSITKLSLNPATKTVLLYKANQAANTWDETGPRLSLESRLNVTTSLPTNTLIFTQRGIPYEDANTIAPNDITAKMTTIRTVTLSTNTTSKTMTLTPITGTCSLQP